MSRKKEKGRLYKVRLLPEDRQLLNRYISRIRQKYGVSSVGLNTLVMTSALNFFNKSCGNNVVFDKIDSRLLLWPSKRREDNPHLHVISDGAVEFP